MFVGIAAYGASLAISYLDLDAGVRKARTKEKEHALCEFAEANRRGCAGLAMEFATPG